MKLSKGRNYQRGVESSEGLWQCDMDFFPTEIAQSGSSNKLNIQSKKFTWISNLFADSNSTLI